MNLYICVPSGDMIHADFMMSLNGMMSYMFTHPFSKDESVNLRVTNRRSALIHMSREEMVENALLGGATHILFLDSDMTFPEDAFHRLFSRNVNLVAANYVKRCLPTLPNAVNMTKTALYTDDDSTGLEQASSVGMGMCLIKSEVFDAMPRPWFDTYWFTDPDEKPAKMRMIGEDVFFCHKATHAGHPLWIDHDLSKEIGHVGTFEYIHPMARME